MKWLEYRRRMLLLATIAEDGLHDSGLASQFENIATAVLPEEYQLDVDHFTVVSELCKFELAVQIRMIEKSRATLREIGMMFEPVAIAGVDTHNGESEEQTPLKSPRKRREMKHSEAVN